MSQFLSCALLAINIATRFATFPPALCNWIASLPHVCRIFAFLFCRIFAACFGCILAVRIFAASLPHLCRIFGCIICFWCVLLAALGCWRPLLVLQSSTKPNISHNARVQKHRFVNVLFVPKTRYFKHAPTTKNKVCPKMPLSQNAGLHCPM